MNRRTFLAITAASTTACVPAPAASIPIIDTHIHLYDPRRPQGIPWPPKDGKVPYKPTLPADFEALTKSLGVVGGIEVECSPWVEDNQWVLDVAENAPVIVGTVGDLEPGKPDFRDHLDRLHKNPLFRGIRYGYLWGRSVADELPKPEFIAGLKALADAGLELDTVGGPQVLRDILTITDKVPDLRIVIDHLANTKVPPEAEASAKFESELREIGKRPHVYVKVSAVLQNVNGKVSYDLNNYRPKLDQFWEIFGEDRLFYGSDWPNSVPLGTYAQVLAVVKEYFTGKGPAVAEKFFWKNSAKAYRWVKRTPDQPSPANA